MKNDCPRLDCNDAVSVPGKCCKVCPEQLKSKYCIFPMRYSKIFWHTKLLTMISAADSENITSDGLSTDDNDSNDNNRGTVFNNNIIYWSVVHA